MSVREAALPQYGGGFQFKVLADQQKKRECRFFPRFTPFHNDMNRAGAIPLFGALVGLFRIVYGAIKLPFAIVATAGAAGAYALAHGVNAVVPRLFKIEITKGSSWDRFTQFTERACDRTKLSIPDS